MEFFAANFVVDHGNEIIMLFKEQVVFNLCSCLANVAVLLAEKLRQSLRTLVLEPNWIYVIFVQSVEEAFAGLCRIVRSS